MKWDFAKKDLVKLYTTGNCRKYRGLPDSVRKKFVARIAQIEAAHTIHDLWKTPSLNFEKLEGKGNLYSVRVDGKWRLEIEVEWDDEEQAKGVFYIKDLNKHYGD